MSQQYFTKNPDSKSEVKRTTAYILDEEFTFLTDHGVFSKAGLDFGSKLLIETFINEAEVSESDNILELGSGYGPILIAISYFKDAANYTGVEVNERAFELASKNQALNNVKEINWLNLDVTKCKFDKTYQHVLTNPPIRAGKDVIYDFVDKAYSALDEAGDFWLVIQKKQGAPSMQKKMEEVFGNVEKLTQKKGYWILRSTK